MLAQLLAEGNTNKFETAWMAMLEATDAPADRVASSAAHLVELIQIGRRELAETLAWAGVEAASARFEPPHAVKVAGAMLVAIGDSENLRKQVSELYRKTYGERDGFEALLKEAGLPVGRPVRRAVRTLEVCLTLSEGDFLNSRDEPLSARVDRIDRDAWQFTITTPDGEETLGAVHLADRFQPVAASDFQVLKHFGRDHLLRRLQDDPVSVIIELCRLRGHKIDSDALHDLLVPDLLSESEWKKWWTQARTAIKAVPHVEIEGRSPYVITFVDRPITFEDILQREFNRRNDVAAQLAAVEQYLRDCAAAGQPPSPAALETCYKALIARAGRISRDQLALAAVAWASAARVGDATGASDARKGLIDLLRGATNLRTIVDAMPSEALLEIVCECLPTARPETWTKDLLTILPALPHSACDPAVVRLLEAGCTLADIKPVVQKILNAPVSCFEALLWLWDGPREEELSQEAAPITILTRILRALNESRSETTVPKETAKRMATRARSVLALRKYERFVSCLEPIEAGMASAIKTQINQLDSLGRAVKEDLLGLILDKFPTYDTQRKTPSWAREDILFVTQRGMARKQDEINHHVNVKMKENAKAIGAAAEKGDLSENSEYKFALEERDLLQARLLQMNSEMAIARPIVPEDVPTDEIGVGTHAVFKRVSDGDRYELTFLGPWDADPQLGILNYKSPLGQQLMGKRVGETIQFDHSGISGLYEIAELHNGLA